MLDNLRLIRNTHVHVVHRLGVLSCRSSLDLPGLVNPINSNFFFCELILRPNDNNLIRERLPSILVCGSCIPWERQIHSAASDLA